MESKSVFLTLYSDHSILGGPDFVHALFWPAVPTILRDEASDPRSYTTSLSTTLLFALQHYPWIPTQKSKSVMPVGLSSVNYSCSAVSSVSSFLDERSMVT